ncbi:MAG: aldo/keto reductase [Fidelibacterota bacterium]
MKTITLGRTGETVSRISLGTWSYGGENTSGTTSVGWAGQNDSDSVAALKKAWELGIRHWDTADVYGNGRSEKIIGTMWKFLPRRDIFLATKVGWDRGGYSQWYHPDMMRQHLENSLRNLQVDEIDLYYLHHCLFESDTILEDAIAQLHRFREEGKIRFIGLSDWDSEKIMQFIARVDPDVVQPYRSVYDDTYASSGLKQWVEDHNVGVCFFSPLKHGLLTGKYEKPVSFPEGDFRRNVPEFGDPTVITLMQENRAKLISRFSNHPQPVIHGVVDALLTDAPTGCVLLGQRNPAQVVSAATLGTPLSETDAARVRSLFLHRKGK